MADTTALKNRIRAAIKANDNQEITGPVLQQTLLDIVDELDLNPELENEALQRQSADTQLNNLIEGIKNNIDNGYVYAGIAIPAGTPISGKVFYLATVAGTYANFGGLIVTQGINVLKYNGSTWLKEQLIEIDDEPTDKSNNLVKSGGIRKYVRGGFLAKDETIISDIDDKIIIEDDSENTIVTVDNNGLNATNLFKNGVEVLDNNDKTELESSINSIATHEIVEDSEQAIVFEDDNGTKYSEILLDENPAEEEAIIIEDNNGNEKFKVNESGVYINGIKHKNPSVIIVDPNGNGDYTTIGSAISNTHDGDTILVMEGVYEEHIDMYNKERHLVGISKESVFVVTHDGLRSNNPCNANVGSIENMTFIAMIDEIPEDYYDRPSIQRSTYGIHIDTRYTSSARHKITIRNCRCISYAYAGIGIGVRYNQTIEIVDCELISYKASAGGFLMHNDDFYPDSNGAEVIVNNCICKGVDKAVTISSMNNNALCTLSFINTTCYTSENGVTNIISEPVNKKWGTDISLGIISHGNNINDLNY